MIRPCFPVCIILALLVGASFAFAETLPEKGLPPGFVDVEKAIPSLLLDMRYATAHNFVGEGIDGYEAAKCILTEKAARALAEVQKELKGSSFSLKVYDCYRPQRAVDHFVRWAKDAVDTRTKKEFYPTVDKANLFRDGYIAEKSGHSRGSTVDVTIVPLPAPEEEKYSPGQPLFECYLPTVSRFRDNGIDMGSGFDCFHEISWPLSLIVNPEQRAARMFLKDIMEKHGFKNYDKEWWHFTLRNEPFPDKYFDFPIR